MRRLRREGKLCVSCMPGKMLLRNVHGLQGHGRCLVQGREPRMHGVQQHRQAKVHALPLHRCPPGHHPLPALQRHRQDKMRLLGRRSPSRLRAFGSRLHMWLGRGCSAVTPPCQPRPRPILKAPAGFPSLLSPPKTGLPMNASSSRRPVLHLSIKRDKNTAWGRARYLRQSPSF